MSLPAWQDALVGLLTGLGLPPGSGNAALSEAEADWLASVVDRPGFALTRRVQRDWRSFRISTSLPLTVRLLGTEFEPAVARYVEAVPQPASFYLQEAEQFAGHVGRACSTPQHLGSVLSFELTMLRLAQWQADPADELVPAPSPARAAVHPAADIVAFSAPPERVLAALVDHQTLPPPGPGLHYLLCAPRTCRRATPAEHRTLRLLKVGGWRRDLELDADSLNSLGRAGALVGVDD